MHVVPDKVLREEIHELHVVLERLQPLPGIVGETRGVFYDGVNPVQSHQEVRVPPEEGVVFGPRRGGVAGEGGLLEVEGGAEVLDGGDGDLVGGVHGDALAETGEDVLELLVGLAGVREHRAEQLPGLSHAQHL